jgi:hypothetical protein
MFNVLKTTFYVPACFYENTYPPPPNETGGNSKRLVRASIQPLKMPTVNHPPEAVRQGGKTGSSETLIGWKSRKITERRERARLLILL